MLTIRFQRKGRKNDPSFKVVVLEKARSPKAGNPLEVLGSHNPKTKHTILKDERIKYWISKGAELSGTVNNLLVSKKIIEGKKVNVLGKKTPIKKEEEAKPEAPKAEAPQATEVEAAPVEEPKAE